MYIIEKLIKIYLKLTKKEKNIALPSNEDISELEDVITCNHNFMPIDSTGEILACSLCGYLIRKDNLKKRKYK
jgi:hypothetical protein